MRSKFSIIADYTAAIFKRYNGILHQPTSELNSYRISEIVKLPNGQNKVVIQIVGKSSVIECLPQEIVANDRFLEGFSKKDVRMITYLACSSSVKKPKYKIIMQEFCEKLNRMIFKLKATEENVIVEKTASQIVMDKNMINTLSQDDVNSISYIAGYESSQRDRMTITESKNEDG